MASLEGPAVIQWNVLGRSNAGDNTHVVINTPHDTYGPGLAFFLREIYCVDTETPTSGRVFLGDIPAILDKEYGLFQLQKQVHSYQAQLRATEWKSKLHWICMAYLQGSDLKGGLVFFFNSYK